MNKLKKIGISIIFFIGLILISNKVSATSITISPSEPKVGDEVKITVTVPNVHTSSVTADVTGVVSGKIKVVDGSLAGQVNTYSNSATFKCEKEGNINVQISSDSSAVLNGQYVDVSAQKLVTVKAKDTTLSDSNNSGTTGDTTTSKSQEARLKNLGIKPNDFSGFKRDTLEYSVEVPNNVSKVNVYATPLDSNAKVTGTGDVTLKEGESKRVTVTVTAEAGNTKTYTLTIKRRTADEENAQTQVSSDASLKSLGIRPDKYDFSGFKKDKTQYSVQVPKDVEEVEVYAEATSDKAKVTGTGKTQLKNGKNTVVIQVTAENGTTQTYTIEVTRGEKDATATTSSKDEFGLSSLEINGLTLNPSFKTGTYEYKVELKEDIDSLDIRTIATDDDTTVEIYGNEGLSLGENTITILVRNEKENKTATYQIIVNKELSEEEKVSWLKPSTWGKEEIIKIIIIAVLIILIVIAIILKVKISKEKNEEEDLEFPGGEELDKALAEHQVLSETAEMQINSGLEDTNNIADTESKNETGFDGTNYIEDIARSKNYKIDYQNDKINNNISRKKGKHF